MCGQKSMVREQIHVTRVRWIRGVQGVEIAGEILIKIGAGGPMIEDVSEDERSGERVVVEVGVEGWE
jgi:hypothetical protein